MLEEIRRRINDQEERQFQESLLLDTDGIVKELTIDDLILLEAARDKSDDCKTLLADMICHLLKMAYSTDRSEHLMEYWLDEIINKSGDTLRSICETTKNAKKYYRAMNNSIEDIFYEGVTRYYWDSQKKKGEILLEGLWLIPDHCPWTAEEIVRVRDENDVNGLIMKITYIRRKRPVFRKRY